MDHAAVRSLQDLTHQLCCHIIIFCLTVHCNVAAYTGSIHLRLRESKRKLIGAAVHLIELFQLLLEIVVGRNDRRTGGPVFVNLRLHGLDPGGFHLLQGHLILQSGCISCPNAVLDRRVNFYIPAGQQHQQRKEHKNQLLCSCQYILH